MLRLFYAGLIGAGCCLAAGTALALDFQSSQSASTSINYSDNIGLDPADEKFGGFSYRAGLNSTASLTGSRFAINQSGRVNFNYASQDRDGQRDLTVDQNVAVDGNVNVWRRRLLLNFDASSSRQLVDLDQGVSLNPVSDVTNRRSTHQVSVTPTFAGRLYRLASFNVVYSRNWSFVSEPDTPSQIDVDVDPQNTQNQSLNVSLASLRASKFGWRGSYARSKARGGRGDGRNEIDSDVASLTLSYRFNQRITVRATGGYESRRRPGAFSDTQGITYSGGFSYSPRETLQVNLNVGKQFGGLSVNGNAAVQLWRKWLLNLAVVTTLDTQERRPLILGDFDAGFQVFDPVSGELLRDFTPEFLTPEDFLADRPVFIDDLTGEVLTDLSSDFGISDEIRRTRALNADLSGFFGRNNVSFSVGVQEATSQVRPDDVGVSGNLSLSRDLPGNQSLSLSGFARYNREIESGFGVDEGDSSINFGTALSYSRALTSRIRISTRYTYSEQRDQAPGIGDDKNFRENSVSVTLRVRL